MFIATSRSCAVWSVLLASLFAANLAEAQDSPSTGRSGSKAKEGDVRLPLAVPGDKVVIKREAARPVDPKRYRVALYLTPLRSVTLVAPVDGLVRGIAVKTGEAQPAQAEAVKLDNTVQKLQVQRAQSLYKAALLEQKLGGGSSDDQKDLAQAKVDAARAVLDLAQHHLDQTSLRLPFAGVE